MNDAIRVLQTALTNMNPTMAAQLSPAIQIALTAIQENQSYQAIGTPEELKDLADRNTPRKIITARYSDETKPFSRGDYVVYRCPHCHSTLGHAFHYPPNEHMYDQVFCKTCGQHLLWRWN